MTVKQILQTIPDEGIRARALRNLQVERAGDTAKNLEHALFTGFLWHRAPEGFDFWAAIHHNIKDPKNKMKVPKPGQKKQRV